MSRLSTVQKSRFELEELEPRILLSGDSGAATTAPVQIVETVSDVPEGDTNGSDLKLVSTSSLSSSFDEEELEDNNGQALERIDPGNFEFAHNGGFTDRRTRNITDRYILTHVGSQVLEGGPFILEVVISPSDVSSLLNADDVTSATLDQAEVQEV